MSGFTIPDWLGILSPFLSGAFGVGVAYGILRNRLADHDRRINALEFTSLGHMTEQRCVVRQTSCKEGLKEDIDEIQQELKDQRKWLQTKFDEISKFMGRVTHQLDVEDAKSRIGRLGQ